MWAVVYDNEDLDVGAEVYVFNDEDTAEKFRLWLLQNDPGFDDILMTEKEQDEFIGNSNGVKVIQVSYPPSWWNSSQPWNHAYEAGPDNICITCGHVGSYIHTNPSLR